MEISNIRISKSGSLLKDNPNNRILAYVAVTLDNSIRLDDIRIVNGDNGIFLGFPTRLRKNGSRKNVVYPISREARAAITNAVMSKYRGEDVSVTSLTK
ncbi:SpoVG family protein [Clostridium sp. MT-14]|uniref:SpoVG family protein n=1 Tax=Clostridium aromativorans TaxID=2836848 RepID=A0ABS8NDP3_9CLOT|nr:MULTISPECIES: SpoVG family protein [Clostridium]MCC9296838.1 SpoVG family protein [Clostridium aromativorans]CAB1249501.1 Putative septation protein SpoVG [Clostridiaceae bacterium BL-3]